MKQTKSFITTLILLFIVGSISSCKKTDPLAGIHPYGQLYSYEFDSLTVKISADGISTTNYRLGFILENSSNPDVSIYETFDGIHSNGMFTATSYDLALGTTYQIQPFLIHPSGTIHGDYLYIDTPQPTGTLQIGEYGPAGGIVFYSDGDGGGLEVYRSILGSEKWGCHGTEIGANSIDGSYNTNAILTACSENTASHLCSALSAGGYNDWYLPSKAEVAELAGILNTSASELNFGVGDYWTSSELESSPEISAKVLEINVLGSSLGASMNNESKNAYNQVIAIRSF